MSLVFLIKQYLYLASIPGSKEFYVSMFLLVSIFLLGCYFFWNRFFKSKPHSFPLGQINEESMICMLLQEVLNQNSYFDIQFVTERTVKKTTLRCLLKHFSTTGITIEISGIKTLQNSWINTPIDAYFRLKNAEGKQSYYMFKSLIQSIYFTNEKVYLVTLAMPKKLENRQKRSSLRISPPYHAVAGATFWYGENMPKTEEMSDITLWKSPLLFYIKDKIDQFSITNISTGGIRLRFPLKVLQLHDIHISSVDSFLIMLDLVQSDSKELLRVWLQCKTQSVSTTQESKHVSVGAQFLAWGKPRLSSQDDEKGIDWLRTSPTSEVDALRQWITQCNLEQILTPQT